TDQQELAPKGTGPRALRTGQGECHGRPPAGGHGDELIFSVREATFEIRLERPATRLDTPGAVVELRLEQELGAALVRRVGRRQPGRLVQPHQRRAGGVSVAVESFELRPA